MSQTSPRPTNAFRSEHALFLLQTSGTPGNPGMTEKAIGHQLQPSATIIPVHLCQAPWRLGWASLAPLAVARLLLVILAEVSRVWFGTFQPSPLEPT